MTWYVENQQLLDKDAQVLKRKEEEVVRLKARLQELSTEVSIEGMVSNLKSKPNIYEHRLVVQYTKHNVLMITIKARV